MEQHIHRVLCLGRAIEQVTLSRVRNVEKCSQCVTYANVLNVQTFYIGAETLADEIGTLIAIEPPY